MKNFTVIRFGIDTDPLFNFALGLLASEPVTIGMKSSGFIISMFKSKNTLEECATELAKCGLGFIITDEDQNMLNYENHKVDHKTKPVTDDEKEKRIFNKINALGSGSLTNEEHEFMKNRF